MAFLPDAPAVHSRRGTGSSGRGECRHHRRVRRCGTCPRRGWGDSARGRPHDLLQRRCEFRRPGDHGGGGVSGVGRRCPDHRDDARRQPVAGRIHTSGRGTAPGGSDRARVQRRWLHSHACLCPGQNAGSSWHDSQVPAGENPWRISSLHRRLEREDDRDLRPPRAHDAQAPASPATARGSRAVRPERTEHP